jgi:TctA family transporter
MKYFLLFGFVALLPPKLYLIGLIAIYWSMFKGGMSISSTLLDMPSTKRLWNLTQTIYSRNKMIKNGAPSSSVSTSSPLPSSGVAANVKTP